MSQIFKALFLSLILLGCRGDPTPTAKPVHLFLGHQFGGGEFVSVKFDGKPMFRGRVVTEDSSQLAASLLMHSFSQSFDLEFEIKPRGAAAFSKTEKIDLAKGCFIVVIFTGSKAIDFFQTDHEPDFY